jgi:hypothetical protein
MSRVALSNKLKPVDPRLNILETIEKVFFGREIKTNLEGQRVGSRNFFSGTKSADFIAGEHNK